MGISHPLLTWTTSIKKVRWLIVPPFFQSDNDEITNSFLLSKAFIKRDWSGSNLRDDAMCLECIIGSSCGSGIFHTIYTTIEK